MKERIALTFDFQLRSGGTISIYLFYQSIYLCQGTLCPVWLEEGACQDPACPFSHSKKEQAQYSHQNKRSFQVPLIVSYIPNGYCIHGLVLAIVAGIEVTHTSIVSAS